jgi:hypothetical protein
LEAERLGHLTRRAFIEECFAGVKNVRARWIEWQRR